MNKFKVGDKFRLVGVKTSDFENITTSRLRLGETGYVQGFTSEGNIVFNSCVYSEDIIELVEEQDETDYLISSSENAKRLKESLSQIDNGELAERELIDPLSQAFEEAEEEENMDRNTITLAQVVASSANKTDDHIQIDIDNTDITVKQVMEMCEEIEDLLDSGDSVTLELWNDDIESKSGFTGSVYEQRINQEPRLLCSFNCINL